MIGMSDHASFLASSDLRGVVLFWVEMSLFSGKRLVPRLIGSTGCGVVLVEMSDLFCRADERGTSVICRWRFEWVMG